MIFIATMQCDHFFSSRSHLLVMLSVEGRDKKSSARTKGTLTLVDLAGSERVSKTDASGQRLVEAAAINKSLTSLGQVTITEVFHLLQHDIHLVFNLCRYMIIRRINQTCIIMFIGIRCPRKICPSCSIQKL